MAQIVLPGDATPNDVRKNKRFSAGANYNAPGGMLDYSQAGGEGFIWGDNSKISSDNTFVTMNVRDGYQGYFDGTSKIRFNDNNLKPENIKKDTTILGVTGTLAPAAAPNFTWNYEGQINGKRQVNSERNVKWTFMVPVRNGQMAFMQLMYPKINIPAAYGGGTVEELVTVTRSSITSTGGGGTFFNRNRADGGQFMLESSLGYDGTNWLVTIGIRNYDYDVASINSEDIGCNIYSMYVV